MRSIIGGTKTDQAAIIKGRRFVFWFNLVLTLHFLILTAYCYYRGKNNTQFLCEFFASLYALCTLILGLEIYVARRFFPRATDINGIRRVIRP